MREFTNFKELHFKGIYKAKKEKRKEENKKGAWKYVNDKFIIVKNGSEISLPRFFSIFKGKRKCPISLCRLRVFDVFSTSSSVTGTRNHVFVLLFGLRNFFQ